MRDPVDAIEWVHARELDPNHWNPNVVFTKEMQLLERSIIERGWVFPIVCNVNNIIIDGFHRWNLALSSKTLLQRYAEEVPVTKLDIPNDEAMIMTVQMNRAKGTHVAVRMSNLVQRLAVEYGKSIDDIAKDIGGTREEVRLLVAGDVFVARDLGNYKYSRAWIPAEVSKTERDAMLARGETSIKPERDDTDSPAEWRE